MQNPPNSETRKIVLRIEGLYKSFRAKPILSGIDLSLFEGEALGLMGPSGSGKSTLLRIIDLLEPFESGSIRYFDSTHLDVAEGQAKINSSSTDGKSRKERFRLLRQNMGFVFQNLNLWEDRTLMDNLVLAPRVVLGESLESCRERASVLCNRYGLHEKRDEWVWKLSVGQRQRVAIMRALMMKPKLMLLDEITSALDPILILDIMDAIRQLRHDGISFILVTHHVEFACTLCDRIAFLQDGQLIQTGTPDALRASNSDPRIQAFLETVRATS